MHIYYQVIRIALATTCHYMAEAPFYLNFIINPMQLKRKFNFRHFSNVIRATDNWYLSEKKYLSFGRWSYRKCVVIRIKNEIFELLTKREKKKASTRLLLHFFIKSDYAVKLVA